MGILPDVSPADTIELMSELEIRPCSAQDISLLTTTGASARELRHHNERFQMQHRGEAVYLLAWNDGELVGRATLFLKSKYEFVCNALGEFPEINALEATPQNTGTGTRLIAAAEQIAASRGAATIGLAVEDSNVAERRLYVRLGFAEWDNGTVVDQWFERDDAGNPTIEHNDECQ